MNKYVKWFLVILEVGGGCHGLFIIWRDAIIRGNAESISIPIFATFSIMSLVGVIAGISLLKYPKLGLYLSLVYQFLQIPYIIDPRFTYVFVQGFSAGAYFDDNGLGLIFNLGADYRLFLNRNISATEGFNVIAIVLVVIILEQITRPNQRVDPTVKTPAELGNEQGTAGHT